MGGEGNLKHVVHKRVHLERPQPLARQKLGYLEKHQDYVKRAKDFHKKEDAIKWLHRKAYFKNEDEFNTRMINHRRTQENGIQKLQKRLTPDQIKLIDSQDAAYIGMRERMDKRFVEKAMESLHFLDAEKPNKHVIFVDEEELAASASASSSSRAKAPKAAKESPSVEAAATTTKKGLRRKLKDFDVAAYFDTHPSLLGRKANRPRLKQLETASFADAAAASAEVRASYKELAQRQERAKQLRTVREELELRNNLRKKGEKVKVAEATDERPAIYRWLPERQR